MSLTTAIELKWDFGDLLVINLLKDIFEATVILFEDGVLGAEVERPGFGQRHLEGAVSKVTDGLVRVVHAQSHASSACSGTYDCFTTLYCIFNITYILPFYTIHYVTRLGLRLLPKYSCNQQSTVCACGTIWTLIYTVFIIV